jgi:hypothetical protein
MLGLGVERIVLHRQWVVGISFKYHILHGTFSRTFTDCGRFSALRIWI